MRWKALALRKLPSLFTDLPCHGCALQRVWSKTEFASRSRKSNAPAARKGLCSLLKSYRISSKGQCALPKSYGLETKSHSRMGSYETASAQRTIRENFSRGQYFDACTCLARCMHCCTRSITILTSGKWISNHYLFYKGYM